MSAVAEYLVEYADQLSGRIEELFEPLHHRGEEFELPRFTRKPLGGQVDAVAALVKALRDGKPTVNLIGEIGSGKTTVATLATHTHAAGKPYRAIVMCPPHLTNKWVREILSIVPGSRPRIIERFTDLVKLSQSQSKPRHAEYYVIADSMAKLGPAWVPAVGVEDFVDEDGEKTYVCHCPQCNEPCRKKRDDMEDGQEFLALENLAKRRHFCHACGSPCWQWTDKPARWPIATFIHKKMRGMFDYALIDELHTAAGANTAVAIAMSKLIASVDHTLTLTGTYLNGYAHGIMHLLWRSNPQTVKAIGFEYGQTTEFAKRYGRLEKTVTSKVTAESNKTSKGSKGRTTVKVRPGVMPTLFGDHLLDKSVFLSLSDISNELPNFDRSAVGIDMDSEQFAAYVELEDAARTAISQAMESRDMRAVSSIIHAMIGYPDHPYGYDPIGYTSESGEWIEVVAPRQLSRHTVRPKEQALVDLVTDEVASGRQCWVFAEMTQKRAVQVRLESLLKARGMRVRTLRSQSVPTKKREEWISKNGPLCDVVIGNPKLTAVGLDFFEGKPGGGYRYNFPTLIFWQTPLETSIARQASGRAFRIGQRMSCKVVHMHYNNCMEAKLVRLMSAKIQASESIDGKFSTDGLSALSDAGDSMGIALARSLLETMATNRSAIQLKTAS